MIALLRYQTAILLRSHRWIFPLIAYGLLLSVGAASGAGTGSAGGTPLPEGLDWSAAMLVPVVAFLTRSMLTAEPDAARACVAAAAGPVRAQLAALITALGAGVVLGIGGAVLELLTNTSVATHPGPGIGSKIGASFLHPEVLLAGLATAVVCLLVASAVGTLLNPPLLRNPGVSIVLTLAAVVFALASGASPARAALRQAAVASQQPQWPGAIPLLSAVCLAAVVWTISVLAAARREKQLPDT
jgi:hypothetical protein